MVKVLALLSSPHPNSTTAKLLNAVIEGAKENGAEVELVHLTNIKPCIDCRACNKLGYAKCAQKDQMTELLPKIHEADVLIHATPVYFFAVNAVMKAYLERWTPFYDAEWNLLPENNFKNKRAITIITSGSPECGPAAATPFRETYKFAGIQTIGEIFATAENLEEKLKEAKALGKKI